MKRFLIGLLFLFAANVALSQRPSPEVGVLSGNVVDKETEEGIAYAVITIKNSADSTVVTGGITDEEGNFTIDKIKLGSHFAEISFIGYSVQITGPFDFTMQTAKQSTGTIVLSAASNELEEVVIESSGPAVRYEIDKKIYDVNQIKAAEGGNAKDVLEQIPSITVDDQGNIQLRGSQNVRVLVNGRPSSFSLQTLLEQTPQKNIKDVEVITNPSAKYDAEGEVGIINLVLKENNIEGFTGNTNVSWGTENKYNAGGGLNLKTKKWNLSSSYNFNRFRDDFFRDSRKEDTFNQPGVIQLLDEDRHFERIGHSVRLGIDHYFDASNTLFLSGSLNPGNGDDESNSLNSDSFIITDGFSGIGDYNRINDGSNDRSGKEVTAGFQHDFSGNPQHNLLIDASYNEGYEDNYARFTNDYSSPLTLIDDIFVNENLQDNKNVKVSADYTNPFDGKKKLELGYKSTLQDQVQNYDYSRNATVINDEIFDYQQDVHAGYATFERQMDKTGIKLGLRGEFSDISSKVTGLSQNAGIVDDYFNLFPSAALSHQLNETTQLRVNYGRRINRPRGQQLIPFEDKTDENNTFKGNAELRPEYTNNYEIGAAKNWTTFSIDGSVYHRDINDHIRYFREVDQNSSASSITFRNVESLKVYGSELSMNYNPFNYLGFSLNGNYNYGKIAELGSNETLVNPSTAVFSSRFSTNARFGKGYNSQLSYRYQSPFAYYQGRLSAQHSMNLSAGKRILQGKGNLYLRANDIFNTQGLKIDFEDSGEIQRIEMDWPSQMMFIGFNFNFGKMKSPAKRKMQRREEQGDEQPSIGLG